MSEYLNEMGAMGYAITYLSDLANYYHWTCDTDYLEAALGARGNGLLLKSPCLDVPDRDLVFYVPFIIKGKLIVVSSTLHRFEDHH